MSNDQVNHPSHYNSNASGVETIEVARKMDFDLGNAWKYLSRFRFKYKPAEDLHKAAWYLNDYVEHNELVTCSDVGYNISPTVLIADEEFCKNIYKTINAESDSRVRDALTLVANYTLFGCSVMLDATTVIKTLDTEAEDIISESIERAAKEREVLNTAAMLLSDSDLPDDTLSINTDDVHAKCEQHAINEDNSIHDASANTLALSAEDIALINTDVEDDTTDFCSSIPIADDVVEVLYNTKTGEVYRDDKHRHESDVQVELVLIPEAMTNCTAAEKLDYAVNIVERLHKNIKTSDTLATVQKTKRTRKKKNK